MTAQDPTSLSSPTNSHAPEHAGSGRGQRDSAVRGKPSIAATKVAVALSIILAVGLAVRLLGISKESLWLDEATSLMLARMPVGDLIGWTAADIHPPLYYVLLHYWLGFGESELVIRGLSTLAGLLTVVVVYGLAVQLFDRRTALHAAGLLAVTPVHIWYSQEARMYAWVTLWIAASLWFALLAWRERRMVFWVAYVLTSVAGLYTHYYAVFGLGLANLFFAYLLVRRRLDVRTLGGWVLAQGAIFVLFLPWLPTFLLPITVGGGGWITMGAGRPSIAVIAQTAVLYMVGTGRELYPALLRRLGYVLFVGLFAWGLWPGRQSPREDSRLLNRAESVALCACYLAIPPVIAWSASQLFKPMYSARYMLPFVVPFVLLVARGVSRLSVPAVRGLVAGLLVAVMSFGIWAQVAKEEKPDWRGWAARIASRSQPGDVVLFMPGWHAKPFDYYARGALELESDVPIPVPRYGSQAMDAVDEAVRGHQRIWFVWENGHYTDPDAQARARLADRFTVVSDEPLPLLGRLVLFAAESAAGG